MPAHYMVELDHTLSCAAGSLFAIDIGDSLRFSLHPCHTPLIVDQLIPSASIACDMLRKDLPFELQCGVAYVVINASRPGPHNVTIPLPIEAEGGTSLASVTFPVLIQPTLQGAVRKGLKHMMLHTQIARLLGPLDTWTTSLEAIAAGGYNSVYLTPVQRLSAVSGSAFCVADQLQLGLSLFDGDAAASTHDSAFEKLRSVIDSCSKKLELTFVTDIVLNHAALDSSFLLEHPEAAYNLNNSPHLLAASLVDAALHSFSLGVLDGHFVSSGLVPAVKGSSTVLDFVSDVKISTFLDVFFSQVLLLPSNNQCPVFCWRVAVQVGVVSNAL